MHLPENVALLAIDFPGHGHSSWLPNGMMYNTLSCVQTVHRVKEHFGMDKFGLMGHSMGGIISFHYTTLFPDNVKFVVCFDLYKHPALNENKYFNLFRKEWSEFFKFEKMTTPPPSYPEVDLIKRWVQATKNSVDEENCRLLMTRGTAKKPDGSLYFSRDPKVKSFAVNSGYTIDHIRVLAKQIHCPYMVVKGNESKTPELFDEDYYQIMNVLKQSSKDFQFHKVPGTHHFHMGNPAIVAQLINPFIQKYVN